MLHVRRKLLTQKGGYETEHVFLDIWGGLPAPRLLLELRGGSSCFSHPSTHFFSASSQGAEGAGAISPPK